MHSLPSTQPQNYSHWPLACSSISRSPVLTEVNRPWSRSRPRRTTASSPEALGWEVYLWEASGRRTRCCQRASGEGVPQRRHLEVGLGQDTKSQGSGYFQCPIQNPVCSKSFPKHYHLCPRAFPHPQDLGTRWARSSRESTPQAAVPSQGSRGTGV